MTVKSGEAKGAVVDAFRRSSAFAQIGCVLMSSVVWYPTKDVTGSRGSKRGEVRKGQGEGPGEATYRRDAVSSESSKYSSIKTKMPIEERTAGNYLEGKCWGENLLELLRCFSKQVSWALPKAKRGRSDERGSSSSKRGSGCGRNTRSHQVVLNLLSVGLCVTCRRPASAKS